MEKMKSYEEHKTEALEEWSGNYQINSPQILANFLDGYDAGHARVLKASEGLKQALTEFIVKARERHLFEFSGEIDLAEQAIEQFQREVGSK